jgi:hypothetical protein
VDQDLDPNLQHWQDRFDNLQWVIGSLSGLLDSIPTLPPAPSAPRPMGTSERLNPRYGSLY